MATIGVDHKPSETALFAALRRTIANKEFASEKFGPDYLAEFFLPAHFRFFLKFSKVRTNTKEKLDAFLPGLNAYMIARTVHFDNLFVDALSNEFPQIVQLGAGYDTRAYRFAKFNRATKIFELDIAPTQNRKKDCLKKAGIDIPAQVKLIPINFNKETLDDVLENAGYKRQDKTLFLWEGVSYYLEEGSVDETIEFVSRSSHKDSSLAFDYTISLSEDNMDSYYGAKKFARTMKEQHGNETLMFSINEGAIETFLMQRNLRMIEHLRNDEIERRYLKDQDGSLIGKITGHFRFVLAARDR